MIQHHKALQWHSILYPPPWWTQTARTDRQWAGKKQPPEADHPRLFILAVKRLIVYWCVCVCDKKLNFLSWAIRPVVPVKSLGVTVIWVSLVWLHTAASLPLEKGSRRTLAFKICSLLPKKVTPIRLCYLYICFGVTIGTMKLHEWKSLWWRWDRIETTGTVVINRVLQAQVYARPLSFSLGREKGTLTHHRTTAVRVPLHNDDM